MRSRIFLLSSLLSLPLLAAEPAMAPAPEPPPAPPTGGQEELQPEVTITHRKDAEVEEYRINGQLYMVKVTPVVGPPYYLIDTTGDGNLNLRRSELDPAFLVPSWMIFRW